MPRSIGSATACSTGFSAEHQVPHAVDLDATSPGTEPLIHVIRSRGRNPMSSSSPSDAAFDQD
ncbi:MAG TPA: hypothetical protein VGJ60_15585 [Chloroflexota bacterium]